MELRKLSTLTKETKKKEIDKKERKSRDTCEQKTKTQEENNITGRLLVVLEPGAKKTQH